MKSHEISYANILLHQIVMNVINKSFKKIKKKKDYYMLLFL